MQIKRTLMAILGFIPFFVCITTNANAAELPYSFSVKWDISKQDNQLVKDFVVNKTVPFSMTELILEQAAGQHTLFKAVTLHYDVAIEFEPIKAPLNGEEVQQLTDLVGKCEHNHYTGKSTPSGITIPVSIKIEKIDGANIVPIVPEKVVNTTGTGGGCRIRPLINDITLPAGKYRISVSTPNAIKLPDNIRTFLGVFAPGGGDQANYEINYKNKKQDTTEQVDPFAATNPKDQTDTPYRQQAFEKAYTSPLNQTVTWNNPATGHSGSVTPLRERKLNSTGQTCRQFKQADDQSQIAVGTAYVSTSCQNSDGTWHVMH